MNNTQSHPFPTFASWWRALSKPTPRTRRTARTNTPNAARRTGAKSHFNLKGVLKPGESTNFAVDGDEIVVDGDTWVFGDLVYGAKATVTGVFRPNGQRYATKIVLER